MVGRALEPVRRLPLGRTLTVALLGLTVALGAIAAVGIANLQSARQRYEDDLSRAYELQAASSRLLAASIIEETALRAPDPAGETRARAAESFDHEAERALDLARGDPESIRLVRARVAAQRRARRLAAGRRSPSLESRLNSALFAARAAGDDLAARQRERREQARERAADDTRGAVVTASVAGGLALVGALLLVSALAASIRRPLEELAAATHRLAEGDLDQRVEPGGPDELTRLGSAFNAMADQLESARQRLDDERRKLAVTIESLGDALVVCDADGTVTTVNPRAEEILPELAPGTRADSDQGPLPPLEEALTGEVMREHRGRTLAVTASRLGGDGAGGAVWTIRDVSERARLERVKSEFVATASHELRSPLTSIKGFVELLGRSESIGGREREFVDVILRSTDRLVDLVNDLLDAARLEAGRMEVHPRLFDLAEVVSEVAALLEPRLEDKGQRLELSLPPNLPRALADPIRMRQIATNLLTNAHEYTGEGGLLRLSAEAEDRTLRLEVSDTGRGMTPDELEHVFDPFTRREGAGRGTGLGLSIVRSLVELQRGTIDVHSDPGRGTTFTVRLPAEPARGSLPAPREVIRGKRVLVVDDEPEVAELVAAQLAAFEVETAVTTSADEAISRLRAEPFDAMTLDILMPGRSGFEVLRTLRADPELLHTPVVVVSALSGSEALLGEWKVTKPVDAEQLADTLGSAVASGRTGVLVVGRTALRPRLEPALVEMGLDHQWVTSGAAARRACERRRFEVALVDAGIRSPQAVMRSLRLRGRRLSRSVILFSTGDDAPGIANLGEEPVPIEDAATTVLGVLAGEAPSDGGPRG